VFLSLAEFKKERALKKERAFPCTSFRKKKLLTSKRESTRFSWAFISKTGRTNQVRPAEAEKRIRPY
jgi:hypothetical protein